MLCRKQEAFRQNAGLQELRDQSRHLQIADASANPLHQLVVIDVVETALDVSFDDPLVGRPLAPAIFGLRSRSHGHADMLQGAVAASSGPKPVRDMPEARLEDRFQKILDRALNDAVSARSGYPGVGTSPVGAAWESASVVHGLGSIPARPQVAHEAVQGTASLPFAIANPRYRHPVDPGGTTALCSERSSARRTAGCGGL